MPSRRVDLRLLPAWVAARLVVDQAVDGLNTMSDALTDLLVVS